MAENTQSAGIANLLTGDTLPAIVARRNPNITIRMNDLKSMNNNIKSAAVKITFLIATIYFIVGNIIGYIMFIGLISSDNFLTNLFFPYTITWGLSAMVGADLLTFLFIGVAFAVSFCLFFPIGFYLSQRKQKIININFQSNNLKN